jgi:hypothetical protein
MVNEMGKESQIELTESEFSQEVSYSSSNEGPTPQPPDPPPPASRNVSSIVRPSGLSKRTISSLAFCELILNPIFMDLHAHYSQMQRRIESITDRVLELEAICDALEGEGALCGSLFFFFLA